MRDREDIPPGTRLRVIGREDTDAGGNAREQAEVSARGSRARPYAQARVRENEKGEGLMHTDTVRGRGTATRADAQEQVVAVVPKGRRTEIRAVLREYDGELLAELRTFVRLKEGRWVPTVRGVALPAERVGELVKAAEALTQAASA